jgi:general secretion pathway protein G
MKNRKGFTLIELLIVMTVIAILISIALPSFRGMQLEAKRTKAQGETRTIQIAIEAYYGGHASLYPAEANYQTTLIGAVPQILPQTLYDPFGATNTTMYVYSLPTHDPTTSKYYIIYSVGPSGNGVASVNNSGTVTVSGEAVWSSNGHI